jgi:hypothetical protein
MAISSQAPQECGEGSTTSAWRPDRAVKHHERAAVRKCSGCKIVQSLECFNKASFLCRPCAKTYLKGYRERNSAKLNAEKIRWYQANRERILSEKKEYTRLVSHRVIARRREQRRNDPRKLATHNYNMALRRAAERRATPAWADRTKIAEMYLLAQIRTKETGVKHSVDHIYPLQAKVVCGLHVATNLQVIPLADNCSKQNTFQIEDIV